jgi:hypothetical protein
MLSNEDTFYMKVVILNVSGINIRDTQLKKVNDTSVLTTRGSGNNLRLSRPLQRKHRSARPPWHTSVSPEGHVRPSGEAGSHVGPHRGTHSQWWDEHDYAQWTGAWEPRYDLTCNNPKWAKWAQFAEWTDTTAAGQWARNVFLKFRGLCVPLNKFKGPKMHFQSSGAYVTHAYKFEGPWCI